MKQQERRLAAAAYDQGREGPRSPFDRTVFVGVPSVGRTLLCDLTLPGDPPEALGVAVSETLAVLRVMWIALLRCDEGPDRRNLAAVHAAMQCDLSAMEWMWSGGSGEGHALARALVQRREGHRASLAQRGPGGGGWLLPRDARASEPFPPRLAAAWNALSGDAASAGRARSAWLREQALDAVGAWRLGEIEAADAAALLEAAIRPPTVRPIVPEELPPLRVAS
ncbi:MAG TPA: hypothetical protein VGL81_11540 [Polyangiaceae bacterium]|jgi:hypothetical protein